MKVLIAELLSEEGLELLRQEGIEYEELYKQPGRSLADAVGGHDALIVRSQVKVTREVIERADRLKIIGRAGVGVDTIDTDAATRKGIVVMNAPDANTIATCELAMALLLAMSRRIPSAANSVKSGAWEKKKFKGSELYGKTLGIVGLGRIGTQVALRAKAFGMTVIAHDPFVPDSCAKKLEVRLAGFEELLRSSDYISFHVALTDETKHMVGNAQVKMMKKGVRIVNCSRGGVLEEGAVVEGIESGKIAGFATDVYENEPPGKSRLLELEEVIPTPHIGASTEEAQRNVGAQIVRQIVDALKGRGYKNAVNIPAVAPELFDEMKPYLNLAEKLGSVQSQVIGGALRSVKITYAGEINRYDVTPMTISVMKGLLKHPLGDAVNYVNARFLAHERGINVTEIKSETPGDFAALITIATETASGESSISGTLFGSNDPRIVRINGHHVDAVPSGQMLVCTNRDKPGAIAHIAGVLGKRQINIAGMTVGRRVEGGIAVTVLNIDGNVTDEVLEEVKKSDVILDVKRVRL